MSVRFDPFEGLKKASDQIIVEQTKDENCSFKNQFKSSGYSGYGHGLYYGPDPTIGELQKSRSVPIPDEIKKRVEVPRVTSFSGIIPELQTVWVTSDNTIFFWNYVNGRCEPYDGLSEVIVSVAASAPKPKVFTESVKYVIIVATMLDVVILACKEDAHGRMSYIQTPYVIPSEGVRIAKVVGTQCGRIFMAGADGSLYELHYDIRENVWKSLVGLEGTERPCKRISREPFQWRNVLPPFVRSILNLQESLDEICVDNTRNLIYASTSQNRIMVMHFSPDGFSIPMVSLVDKSTATIVKFTSLKQLVDTFIDASRHTGGGGYPANCADGSIVGLFPIAPTESACPTPKYGELSHVAELLVVLKNGYRVYLQLNYDSVYGTSMTGRLEVKCLRPPPPKHTELTMDGSKPATNITTSNSLKASAVYYSHGLLLLGDASVRETTSGAALDPLYLICVAQDLRTRRSMSADKKVDRYGQPANLRETCTGFSDPDRKGGEVRKKRVLDIKESCASDLEPHTAVLRALMFASKTPPPTAIGDDTIHTIEARISREQELDLVPRCPASTFPAMASPGFLRDFGLPLVSAGVVETQAATDFSKVAPLNEMGQQALPCDVSRRELLCLTTEDLIFFEKQRPVDSLVAAILRGGATEAVKLFEDYGCVPVCAMALQLLCGLPRDASARIAGAGGVLREVLSFGVRAKVEDAATIGSAGVDPAVEAVFVAAGRILRPIWLRPVAQNDKLASFWPHALGLLLERLQALREVLTSFPHFSELIKFGTSAVRAGVTGGAASSAGRTGGVELYRLSLLVGRSIHALSLLHIMADLAAFDWSSFGRKSFKALVVSAAVQKEVSKMIQKCLDNLTKTKMNSDRLIRELTTRCYYYFSQSDVAAIKATKQFIDLKDMFVDAPFDARRELDRQAQRGELYRHVLEACGSWQRLADVQNQSHVSGDCKLRSHCRRMLDVCKSGGDCFEGIIHLCLATAENFNASPRALSERMKKMLNPPVAAGAGGGGAAAGAADKHLFHGIGSLSRDDEERGREACYDCLIENLEELLGLPLTHDQISQVIKEIWDTSSDRILRTKMFEMLLDVHENVLMVVPFQRHPREYSLVQFLDEQGLHDLLYRYLDENSRYVEAAQYMYKQATTPPPVEIDIEQRIAYMRKAVSSAERGKMREPRNDKLSASLVEMKSDLAVMELQKQAHETVASTGGSSVRLAELKKQVLDPTRLYAVVYELSLWDFCIRILHHCGTESQAGVGRQLWRSIIVRHIPRAKQEILQRSFPTWFNDGEPVIRDGSRALSRGGSDDDAWLAGLRISVSTLLGHLSDGEGQLHEGPALPVKMVLNDLEQVVTAVDSPPAVAGWATSIFLEAGMSHRSVLDLLLQNMQYKQDWNASTQLSHIMRSATHLLRSWAEASRYQTGPRQDFEDALRSGLLEWCVQFLRRHQLKCPGTTFEREIYDNLQEVENVKQGTYYR